MAGQDLQSATELPSSGHSSPSRASVVTQHKLLEDCCRNPLSVEEDLRSALLTVLKSQGSFARFDWPAKNIIGMSLNTHKTAANETLAGGYTSLDSHRKAALQSLLELRKVESRPTRNTISWYKTQHEIKDVANNKLINDMAVMAQRLDETMEYARKLAKKANKAEEFLEKQTELLRKFPTRGK